MCVSHIDRRKGEEPTTIALHYTWFTWMVRKTTEYVNHYMDCSPLAQLYIAAKKKVRSPLNMPAELQLLASWAMLFIACWTASDAPAETTTLRCFHNSRRASMTTVLTSRKEQLFEDRELHHSTGLSSRQNCIANTQLIRRWLIVSWCWLHIGHDAWWGEASRHKTIRCSTAIFQREPRKETTLLGRLLLPHIISISGHLPPPKLWIICEGD